MHLLTIKSFYLKEKHNIKDTLSIIMLVFIQSIVLRACFVFIYWNYSDCMMNIMLFTIPNSS